MKDKIVDYWGFVENMGNGNKLMEKNSLDETNSKELHGLSVSLSYWQQPQVVMYDK